MKVVIDTNVYSDAMRGLQWAVNILKAAEEILLSPIVVAELFSGFRLGAHELANRRLFQEFLSSTRVKEAPVVRETAERFSLIFKNLKKLGKPIPTNDLWIAATAFEYGAALATRDAHFKQIDGLYILEEI